jgi:hypothetical protein
MIYQVIHYLQDLFTSGHSRMNEFRFDYPTLVASNICHAIEEAPESPTTSKYSPPRKRKVMLLEVGD